MRTLMKALMLGLLVFSSPAGAATVAVVDSGTDFQHGLLEGAAWRNPGEIPGDMIDNDGNGKVDDSVGWNFADQFWQVFYPVHLREINPIVYPLLEIIAHRQAGVITPLEEDFFEKNFSSLPEAQKRQLVLHLNYFGLYAHGTHVSGIVRLQSTRARIFSARVFPDDPPPLYPEEGRPRTGFLDWAYRLLALLTNGTFHQVSAYLKETHADVANMSLGIGLPALAKASLQLRGNKNPSREEVAREVKRIYAQFEPEGKKWMAASPATLFVIAAGNEANDNDSQPAFPSNVAAVNAISVAATLGRGSLASFSNYGARTVDVAAPGVAVLSSVPSLERNRWLPLSGTSMAAPFVAGVAAEVKDANPDLRPEAIKKILMATVDKKDWLEGKVLSGGIVNPERAKRAAALSARTPLDAAIRQAQAEVADLPWEAGARPLSSKGELGALAEELVF